MREHKIFIDRRKGNDRRLDSDPCKNMPLDLYHRKRRKSTERRTFERDIADDFLALWTNSDNNGTRH
jgi:hypothetical protein